MKHSAALIIDQGIQIPKNEPLKIIGKCSDGRDCLVYINATGIAIKGAKGTRLFSWDGFLALADPPGKAYLLGPRELRRKRTPK